MLHALTPPTRQSHVYTGGGGGGAARVVGGQGARGVGVLEGHVVELG